MSKKTIYIKLISILLKKGKKSLGLLVIKRCFLYIKYMFKLNPYFIFHKAIENVVLPFELIKIKKGSQVVFGVKLITTKRRFALAIRWLVGFSRIKKHPFFLKFATELYTAAANKGKACDKKLELLKKAELYKTNLKMRIQQLLKKKRKNKQNVRTNMLSYSPQIKGICVKVFTISPRKPNSAVRKVTRVKLSNEAVVTAYIRGEGHSLQEHATVLIQGGKTKDLPGVRYKIVRGVFDANGVLNRKTSRSKYGTKKTK